MKFNLLILSLLFCMAMPCEVNWDCKTCTLKRCTYVITKSREYCAETSLTDSITGVESLLAKDYLCKPDKNAKSMVSPTKLSKDGFFNMLSLAGQLRPNRVKPNPTKLNRPQLEQVDWVKKLGTAFSNGMLRPPTTSPLVVKSETTSPFPPTKPSTVLTTTTTIPNLVTKSSTTTVMPPLPTKKITEASNTTTQPPPNPKTVATPTTTAIVPTKNPTTESPATTATLPPPTKTTTEASATTIMPSTKPSTVFSTTTTAFLTKNPTTESTTTMVAAPLSIKSSTEVSTTTTLPPTMLSTLLSTTTTTTAPTKNPTTESPTTMVATHPPTKAPTEAANTIILPPKKPSRVFSTTMTTTAPTTKHTTESPTTMVTTHPPTKTSTEAANTTILPPKNPSRVFSATTSTTAPTTEHTTESPITTVSAPPTKRLTEPSITTVLPSTNPSSVSSTTTTNPSTRLTKLTTEPATTSVRPKTRPTNVLITMANSTSEKNPYAAPLQKKSTTLHSVTAFPPSYVPSPEPLISQTSTLNPNLIMKPTHKKSTKESTDQRDLGFELSDTPEIFMLLPWSYKCDEDRVRNESLLVAYASSLCTIARLSEAHGIDNFSDTDKAYFLLNRFRKWNGTCKSIWMYRRQCRVPQPKPQRLTKYGIRQGPPSPLFASLDNLFSCNKNEKKEKRLSKLARILCYSGEIFMQLQQQVKLNNYDFAYGISNPSFKYSFKCLNLYFKKRNCFNLKKD